MKKSLVWIAVILVMPVSLLMWCNYIENPTAYFATYDDAKESGVMDAGWIPTFIPQSSYDLKETHNIDTNAVRVLFKYDPADKQSVKDNCQLGDPLVSGEEYQCEYFSNEFTIKLYSDGSAELFSQGERIQ